MATESAVAFGIVSNTGTDSDFASLSESVVSELLSSVFTEKLARKRGRCLEVMPSASELITKTRLQRVQKEPLLAGGFRQ